MSFLNSYSSEKKGIFKKIDIKILGGTTYNRIGDINLISREWDERFEPFESFGRREGKIREFHWSEEIEFEVLLKIKERWGFSVGSGYIKSGRDDFAKYYYSSSKAYRTGNFNTDVSSIPIKLSAYYSIPLSSRMLLYLKGGLGYYFTELKFFRKMEYKPEMASPEGFLKDIKVKGGKEGFHFGEGVSFKLGKNLDFIIEGEGRFLKIDNLKGQELKEEWEFEYHRKEINEGSLNYIEVNFGYYIWKDVLIGESFFKKRKAILDLSGFSIKGGIKIKL